MVLQPSPFHSDGLTLGRAVVTVIGSQFGNLGHYSPLRLICTCESSINAKYVFLGQSVVLFLTTWTALAETNH